MGLDSRSMLIVFPEHGMFRLLHCLNCHSLRSAYFRRFRRYYEVVRLLPTRRLVLGFLGLVSGLPPYEEVGRSPRYVNLA